MIKIIGKKNCSACMMVKTIFDNKNIEYIYEEIEKLPQEEQDNIIAKATEQSKLSMPLIIKDGNLYSFQEILKEV